MPSATATETRAERINRYVELNALNIVLRGGQKTRPVQELFSKVDVENIAGTLSGPVWEELWPGEDDDLSEECALADVRSYLLAAKLFERIADIAPREAAWYRELARLDLGEIMREQAKLAEA
jgi:hypothetical protein